VTSGHKQLWTYTAQYPRHTWQSWRDHYIKFLRGRPPSAFNIPDSAPPSPPSDNLTQQAGQSSAAPRPAKRAASVQRHTQAPKKVSGRGITRDSKADVAPDYTLEQLEATFTSEDWEELYAFVDIIDAVEGKKNYDQAWEKWAKAQDNQTVDQWRQYFEKVVRPQWQRDPESKREQIRNKVEERHQAASSQQMNEEAEAEAEAIPAIDESNVATQRSTEAEPIEDEPTEVNDTQDVLVEQELEAKRIGSDNAAAYFYYAREQKWSTWNAQPELDYSKCNFVGQCCSVC
jgi:hypothetical protein